MRIPDYVAWLITLATHGRWFKRLCERHEDCKGCPFKDGMDRQDIAYVYDVDESYVSCAHCDYYDKVKRYCNGWEEAIKDDGHYCVFYMAKEEEE